MIGNVIKQLRKEKYKQGTFAKLVGISQTALSQIENNKVEPRGTTLDTICEKLGVDKNLLLLLSIDKINVFNKEQDELAETQLCVIKVTRKFGKEI